jgi:hypothetical protein
VRECALARATVLTRNVTALRTRAQLWRKRAFLPSRNETDDYSVDLEAGRGPTSWSATRGRRTRVRCGRPDSCVKVGEALQVCVSRNHISPIGTTVRRRGREPGYRVWFLIGCGSLARVHRYKVGSIG